MHPDLCALLREVDWSMSQCDVSASGCRKKAKNRPKKSASARSVAAMRCYLTQRCVCARRRAVSTRIRRMARVTQSLGSIGFEPGQVTPRTQKGQRKCPPAKPFAVLRSCRLELIDQVTQ